MAKKKIVLFIVAISLVVIATFSLVILINLQHKSTALLKTYVYGLDEKNYIANTVHTTANGGYIVSGNISTASGNGWKGSGSFLMKVDSFLNPQWSKTFPFDDSWDIPTKDGFAVLGSDYQCFYLIKLDNNGNVLWSKKYAGLGGLSHFSFLERGIFTETSDGGFIAVGNFSKPSNDYRTKKQGALVVKFDRNGNVQWTKMYESRNDFGAATISSLGVKELPNKHFIAAMSIQDAALFTGGGGVYGTANDFLIMEIDTNGNIVYARRVGRSKSNEIPTSIILNTNGGCTVSGWGLTVIAEGPNSTNAIVDIPLVQLDSTGNVVSCKDYKINSKHAACGYADIAPDGGCIIASGAFLRLNNNGKVMWTKGSNDYPVSFVEKSNDGYVAIGNSSPLFPQHVSKKAKGNFFIIKFKNNDLNKAIFKNVNVKTDALYLDINTSINLEVSDVDVKGISVSSVKVKTGKIKFKEINTIN